MRRFILLAAAATLALSVHAEERRKVSPLAIYGVWLGATGAPPESCEADGYVVYFGAVNAESFRMTVQPRTGGVKAGETITDYKVMEAPASAPGRLEIFLTGKKGDLGIDQVNGSQLELVPAGADNTYPSTSLYLRRCGSA
ncbi:MAG: hypothetical protein QM698_09220 [Micropepsaceae bacterium]